MPCQTVPRLTLTKYMLEKIGNGAYRRLRLGFICHTANDWINDNGKHKEYLFLMKKEKATISTVAANNS